LKRTILYGEIYGRTLFSGWFGHIDWIPAFAGMTIDGEAAARLWGELFFFAFESLAQREM
jgi:hypothetical protein